MNKIERMNEFIKKSEYDAVLAISMENVYYLSDAWILTQKAIPDRLAVVIWPREGDPIFVVCTIEESLARDQSWIDDIRGYVEFETSPIDLVADVLEESGLSRGNMGYEEHYLTAFYYKQLIGRLPEAKISGCEDLFNKVRMVKTNEEVEILSQAAHTTDKSIWNAFTGSKLGDTERQIGERMHTNLLKGGADNLAFLVLGSGDTAKQAHPSPRSIVPQSGDILRIDFGGQFRGYYSDLARTAVFGKASDYQRDVYRKLWDIHQTVIQNASPGASAKSLFLLCRDETIKADLNFFMPHIGHGLGVGLHEYPMLNELTETPLEENMVIAIETFHREPDGTLYHLEDLIVVKPSGGSVVSRVGDWEEILEIT